MDFVGNNDFDVRVGADAIAGVLATATVHLGQADLTPNRTTTKADLVAGEATYSGYAALPVTWLSPSVDDAGIVEVVGIVDEFRPTGSTVGNSIYYLYVLSAVTGTPLALAARFDNAPLAMEGTLDSIVVTLRYNPTTGGTVAVVS